MVITTEALVADLDEKDKDKDKNPTIII
jgi:hypothetical protein